MSEFAGSILVLILSVIFYAGAIWNLVKMRSNDLVEVQKELKSITTQLHEIRERLVKIETTLYDER